MTSKRTLSKIIILLMIGQSLLFFTNTSNDLEQNTARNTSHEEEVDLSEGGYNLITNDWWQPSATRFNVTVDDSDGDGWNNDVDIQPMNPAVPVPVAHNDCHILKAECVSTTQGFGGASEPDFVIGGGYTRDMSLGDFDGDGDLDFSRANGRANYLTNENGTFESGSSWNGAIWRDTTATNWADIDGDGDIDLTTGSTEYTFAANVDIYFNENGSIPHYPSLRTEFSASVHDLEWADLTGDNHQDLIVSSLEGYIILYLDVGDGLTPASNESACAPTCIVNDDYVTLDYYIMDVDLSDYDNDGDQDIFAAHQSGVSLIVNDFNANGTFWEMPNFNPTDNDSASDIALADVDGDGWNDLLVGGSLSPLLLFHNDGGLYTNHVWWESQAKGTVGGLELADMDNDGDFDIVVGFEGQKNMVFTNYDGVIETVASWQTTTFSDTLSIEVGDIDGDGDNDIIFGNAEVADEVYLNHDRAVSNEYGWHDEVLTSTQSVESADVNGDGYMDVFFGNNLLYTGTGNDTAGTGNDMLYLGSADGLSDTPIWQSVSDGWTTSASWFDYDNDGDMDIFVGKFYDEIYENLDGNLSQYPIWTSQYGTYTSDVEVSDFDNDGDWDVAVATSSGQNYIYKCCNLSNELYLGWVVSPEMADQSMAVDSGDLNDDGYMDLIFASGVRWGQNHVYLNYAGQEQSGALFPDVPSFNFTSPNSKDVSIADINGDGREDVLFADFSFPNSMYFYDETVNGTMKYTKKTSGGWQFTHAVDVGDIDADGDLDIVWANSNAASKITILENGVPTGGWTAASSLSARDVVMADATGDGALDIILATGDGLFENVVYESGTDGDGDWVIDEYDAFPLDPTQATDDDGDGFGDHARGRLPDSCTLYRGDSWRDRWGCPDMDSDGQSDLYDAFITQSSQWSDVDGDGFGDNWVQDGLNETRATSWPGQWIENAYLPDPSPLDFDNDNYEDEGLVAHGAVGPFDDCPMWHGTSSQIKFGCIDSDLDGWSDSDDDLPNEASQHADTDGDGWGDNPTGIRADLYPNDATQWQDADGDGYGDNQDGNNSDAYPLDPTQHQDSDGDGFGDSENGSNSDACPLIYGSSFKDSFGCHDADGDGWSNLSDIDDNNSQIWSDLDGDGFYDQPGFEMSDDCVNQFGISLTPWRGCSDIDRDGIMDLADLDADGDGVSNNDELQAGGAEGISYDIYDYSSRPSDLDRDGVPDSLDEDKDGDGFPNEMEKERGSDPYDKKSTPMNLYGDASTGIYYVPGEGFKSAYDSDGYEISVSFFLDILTSEMLIPLLMIPITALAMMRKRFRYRGFRKRLEASSSLEELEGAEEALDTMITKRKLKVEQAMLLRNQLERIWAEHEEEPEGSTSLDFISTNQVSENPGSGRY